MKGVHKEILFFVLISLFLILSAVLFIQITKPDIISDDVHWILK